MLKGSRGVCLSLLYYQIPTNILPDIAKKKIKEKKRQAHTHVYLNSTVVTPNLMIHIGLCDVSRHPLHRQPSRPDSHCC